MLTGKTLLAFENFNNKMVITFTPNTKMKILFINIL